MEVVNKWKIICLLPNGLQMLRDVEEKEESFDAAW